LHVWAKKRKTFTGADVRKDLRIHPRMVQRYLAELSTFGLVKLVGGHPRKGGYSYAITGEGAQALRERIHTSIEQVITRVRDAHAAREQGPTGKRPKK
jgi:DNA primase